MNFENWSVSLRRSGQPCPPAVVRVRTMVQPSSSRALISGNGSEQKSHTSGTLE